MWATMNPDERERRSNLLRQQANDMKGKVPWNKGKHTNIHPRSEFRKGITPWHKGKHTGLHPNSEFKKGLNPWNKGKHPNLHSPSEYKKGHKHPQEIELRRIRNSRISNAKHPTKPENTFMELCKKHDLPYRYTGDGSFWIETLNPDFVECNGKKIAIEVFGDYWHSPLLKHNVPYSQTLDGRRELLQKYGWNIIPIWASELLSNPDAVLERLRN